MKNERTERRFSWMLTRLKSDAYLIHAYLASPTFLICLMDFPVR